MWLVRKLTTLLKLPQLYAYQSTGHYANTIRPEDNVIKYLKKWNPALKEDTYGNLFILNPWTPLVCAHMDTVQTYTDTYNITNNWLVIIKWDIKQKPKVSPITKIETWWGVIWWDDKCWVAMIMQLYEEYGNNISILFTRQEETWCQWIASFVREFGEQLKELNYCLVLDRRWEGDIIWFDNWYCSKVFEKNLAKHIKKFWFEPTAWFCSDANTLSRYLNTVNLSVWYYNPHMENEYVSIQDFLNAYNAIDYLLQNFWEWDVPKYTYTSKKWFYKYNNDIYNNNYDDDDYRNNIYGKKNKKWNYNELEVTKYMCMDEPEKYHVIYDNTTWQVFPEDGYEFIFANHIKVNDYRVKKKYIQPHQKMNVCSRCHWIWYLTRENDICDKCQWTGNVLSEDTVIHQMPLLPSYTNAKALNTISANISIENENTLIVHADIYLRNKKDNKQKIFLPRGRYFYHK